MFRSASCVNGVERHGDDFSVRIFGTPTLGCRADRPGESSTSARCSGSEKRAEKEEYNVRLVIGSR